MGRTIRAVGSVAAMVGVLLLGACAQQQDPPTSIVYSTVAPATPDVAAPADPAGQDSGFTVQDISFLQQMSGHHEQAIRMTTIALNRSTDQRVKDLAESERGVALSEVQQMSDWMYSIGVQPQIGDPTAPHSHGGGMTEADVDQLDTLSGADFDARFVDLMTQHSLGAIPLAQDEATTGANAGATRLAAEIARRESEQVTTLATLG